MISLVCHTPIVISGKHVNSSPFSRWNVRNNRRWHVHLMPSGVSARPMAAFSGFFESHEPPPLGDARSILPAHRNGHQNGQQSFCWLLPWRPPGQYIVSSCPMVACSGFYQSHGPPFLVMRFLLHRRTAMLIEMADGRGALFTIVNFFIDHNRS